MLHKIPINIQAPRLPSWDKRKFFFALHFSQDMAAARDYENKDLDEEWGKLKDTITRVAKNHPDTNFIETIANALDHDIYDNFRVLNFLHYQTFSL